MPFSVNLQALLAVDGNWRGRGDVIGAAKRNYARLESQQPSIEALISQGDSVAVLMHERGKIKSSGEAYRMRAVQWFTFADGKIRKIDQIAAGI
jgi:ketosteroid isomerase-like protein